MILTRSQTSIYMFHARTDGQTSVRACVRACVCCSVSGSWSAGGYPYTSFKDIGGKMCGMNMAHLKYTNETPAKYCIVGTNLGKRGY